ncbi:MAG: hypothetical protein ACRBB2_08740 [Nitrosopumilus sp.]
MSHDENSQKISKDVFSTCQKNVDRIFTGVKKSVPQYHQSITNMQQEYLQAFENLVNSTLTLQSEYVKKTGIATSVPEVTLKMMHGFTEDLIKTSSIQNQVILTTIDVNQQNIKTFNDHVASFVDLHRTALQSWISACSIKYS